MSTAHKNDEEAKVDHEAKADVVVHEIDGIQEYDNRLPNWWLYSLFGTVAFAFLYWFTYHSAGFALNPEAQYRAESEAAAAARASNMQVGAATPEALTALAHDPTALALGKQVFGSTCAPCHRGDGGGVVGPNLTDDFWLHGATPDAIYKTVEGGVSDKGMPAWGTQLGAVRTQAVVAYVMSVAGTNVAGGKGPQGERVANH